MKNTIVEILQGDGSDEESDSGDDSDGSDASGSSVDAPPEKAKKAKGKSGYMRLLTVSPALAPLFGVEQIQRSEVRRVQLAIGWFVL